MSLPCDSFVPVLHADIGSSVSVSVYRYRLLVPIAEILRESPHELRRYRTAAGLAADLRRWLAAEPIRARPVGLVERLWLWAKCHPAQIVTGGLAAVALVALTSAPVAAIVVAVAAGSLLFALHKVKAAAALRETVDELKRSQQKTAVALQFAFRNCSLAREEQQRAVAAEAQIRRRLAQARELARPVLFDLPDKLNETPGAAPARAFLVRTALAYLDGLAGETGDAAVLTRELAVAYGWVGDVLGSPYQGTGGDAAAALAGHRKSLEIFTALAGALPDNAQAQSRPDAQPRQGRRPRAVARPGSSERPGGAGIRGY